MQQIKLICNLKNSKCPKSLGGMQNQPLGDGHPCSSNILISLNPYEIIYRCDAFTMMTFTISLKIKVCA